MVANTDKFLDIYDIWVNELIGNIWLAIFLGLIVIFFMTIRSKLPVQVSAMFSVLFLAAIFAKTGLTTLWVFTVLGVGLVFYYRISKIIRSG